MFGRPTFLNPVALARHLIQLRSLILGLVRRDIESRYRGSLLGILWAVLQPLTLLLIYTWVFGRIFHARWPGSSEQDLAGFALTLFCGFVPFSILSDCCVRSPQVITSVPSYVKRTVFPVEVLAVSTLGAALFHALVSLAVLLGAALVVRGSIPWTIVLVPLVSLPVVMLSLGATWLLASLGVFVRDLGMVVGLAMQVLLFLTPIFYPIDAVPVPFRRWIEINPMTWIVENFRRVVLWAEPPDWIGLAGWTAVCGVLMMLGYSWFMKTKHAFADVL